MPSLQSSAIHKTPERWRPANVATASAVEDDLEGWMAYIAEFFGEVGPPATETAHLRQPINPSGTRTKPAGELPLIKPVPLILPKSGTTLLSEHLVSSVAYVLVTAEPLDEEVELCWPLSAETEGQPGPELAEFKRFHYEVWKRFGSAEDLMTDKYLEVRSATFGPQIFGEFTIAHRYSAAVTAKPSNVCSPSIYLRMRTRTPRAKSAMPWLNKHWPTPPRHLLCSVEGSSMPHLTIFRLWSSDSRAPRPLHGHSSAIVQPLKRRMAMSQG